MTNIMMMTAAFLIMTGVALFYMGILRLNMGEGMILSAGSMMLVLFVSAYFAGTFRYGMWTIYILAGLGLVCLIWRFLKRTSGQQILPGWPMWLVLAGLFLMWLVIYHNDFIQHTDEFHLWAALVRYMEQKDRLPWGTDFIASGDQRYIASSLFISFFQIFGGYNEGNMYVASTLLTFMGLLLPFAGAKKEDLKKILFYTALMYIAIFSLYMYTTKTLYVDTIVIGWAGGTACWWMSRQKQKRNILLVPVAALVVHFTKMSAGLLMALYMVAFILGYHFLIEKGYLYKEEAVKKLNTITVILVICILAGSAGIIAGIGNIHTQQKTVTENGQEVEKTVYTFGDKELPQGISDKLAFSSVSMHKVKKTMGPFLTRAVGHPMGNKSNLKLPFIPFMIFLLILLSAYGEWNHKKTEVAYYRNYMILMSLSYCAVLFFSFIFMFAYNLSVTVRGCARYFSTCATFWFVIIIGLYFHNIDKRKETSQRYMMYLLFIVFLSGLNNNFIPNVTACDPEKVTGYSDIMTTKHRAEKVKEQIQENDKVYFLYQIPASDEPGDADLVTSPVLYYLDSQVSNYGEVPWRFYDGGCNISLEDVDALTLQNLPDLLSDGGYTYLWIYRADNYLKEELPGVMNYDEKVKAGLYQVIYEDGRAVGLNYVSSLN